MKNPIDKDKVAEQPGILPYPHQLGSLVIKPEDEGKLKSRALTAMQEQTKRQLALLQRQANLIAEEADKLKARVEISEKIYTARFSFEPFVGHVYHLYKKQTYYQLMLIGPDEWGTLPGDLEFLASVKLLADHTWEILENTNESFSFSAP